MFDFLKGESQTSNNWAVAFDVQFFLELLYSLSYYNVMQNLLQVASYTSTVVEMQKINGGLERSVHRLVASVY